MHKRESINLDSNGQLTGKLDDLKPMTKEGKEAKSRATKILKEHGKDSTTAIRYLIKVGMLTPTGKRRTKYTASAKAKISGQP